MVRTKSTNNEKIAQEVLGDSDFKTVNMRENSIDALIDKERGEKFNSQVEQYNEMLDKNKANNEEARKDIQYDINKAEIKPMFGRILVIPFKQNPF